ncbi:MAG: LysR substrate-binding domain-containing protein, partial [Myxococcota bacterium]
MLVPALLRRLAIEAPDLNLSIVQWEPAWREHLERGTIDLTIGAPTGEEPGIYSRLLLENQWTCVLRKGHRALRKRWTPESYASLGHMIVSLSGRGGGQVDRQLEALGLTRRIVLRIPYSTLTPLLVAETELVLTTAHWLAVKLNASGTLAIKRPPFELPPVKLPMVWHERTHRDPQQRWFRTLLAEVAAEVDPLL